MQMASQFRSEDGAILMHHPMLDQSQATELAAILPAPAQNAVSSQVRILGSRRTAQAKGNDSRERHQSKHQSNLARN
jgi:hypothetical protein